MADRPEFTIVDLRSGRGLGGHCFDYLVALKAAFADREIAIIAPFVGPDAAPNNRLTVYVRGFFAYRRAIADRGIGLVHNSSLNDYICLALAALLTRPSRRGFCMMMLYRDPSISSFGAGSERLNRATIWLISKMIRGGVLRPMSDSPLVLEHWLEATATSAGYVVPTPPLPTAEGDEQEVGSTLVLPAGASPLFVIPGRMRAEKGAASYAVVVEAVLEGFPAGVIVLQAAADDEVSAEALATLRKKFGDNPRLVLLEGHLSADDYRTLLAAADVAVLPYDTAAYGAGSSGVVGDALASGAIVVASPIEWIRLEHGDDPRVVLLDDPGSVESVGAALKDATTRSENAAPASDSSAEFAARWNEAVSRAIGD
ncbi:MAG: glycosyltransferase [Thermoleophilaceae bacterium]|nr:glycosyltransferase [Thermoleophilaceae bacterium]